ncbi:hypothetical protein OG229_02790 [Streptomyces platensis]|uniref:hypothetical protein n=1 Tax=Streptomyces platensis TaxID=58346 RepID=UPI002E12CAA2|nr:hypothetical protein OG229_02790 [Streptomyces platensis]
MSLELRSYRTARTAKRCSMHGCRRTIQPGDRYLRTSLPPLVDANSSEHWWSLNVCTVCMRDDTTAEENSAARFNEQHPIGTPVRAYPGFRPEVDPSARRLDTRTRSVASVRGRTAVVWVEGHGAYIALTHIDVIDAQPDEGGVS